MSFWDFLDEHFVRVALAALIFAAMVGHYTRAIIVARGREHTRREVAAYLAEGSIRAEDAVAILSSGEPSAVESITDAVAMGVLNPEKAEKLVLALQARPVVRAEAAGGA